MQEIYKIVKIISEYRVVVNVGSPYVKEGTVLEVFETGMEIKDPDTGESLGTLDYVKAKLAVEDVLPQICVCRNYYKQVIPSAIFSTIDSFGTKERIKELNVDNEEISGGYENVNKKIVVGDKVRKSLV